VLSEFNIKKTRTVVGENDSKNVLREAPGVIEKRVLVRIQLRRRIKSMHGRPTTSVFLPLLSIPIPHEHVVIAAMRRGSALRSVLS
jgi:hypothetical protein